MQTPNIRMKMTALKNMTPSSNPKNIAHNPIISSGPGRPTPDAFPVLNLIPCMLRDIF